MDFLPIPPPLPLPQAAGSAGLITEFPTPRPAHPRLRLAHFEPSHALLCSLAVCLNYCLLRSISRTHHFQLLTRTQTACRALSWNRCCPSPRFCFVAIFSTPRPFRSRSTPCIAEHAIRQYWWLVIRRMTIVIIRLILRPGSWHAFQFSLVLGVIIGSVLGIAPTSSSDQLHQCRE